MQRRRFLAAAGLGAGTIAGCVGRARQSGRDSSEGDTGADNTETVDFPPVDEPADVPDDEHCGVCNMTPADFPQANTQVAHADESRRFFCSPGCVVTYVVAPDVFATTDADVHRAWARDVETEALTRLGDLSWVLDLSPDRGVDPMRNPVPFLERMDAVAYVEEWPDLTEERIVSIEEFDRDTVMEYREWYFD